MMVAVYARVSTLEQTENYSISSQVEKIKAYCMAKDWTIYDTYIDGGFTGTNIEPVSYTHLTLPTIYSV